MKYVAVTSCPTGIAHTYMAAEALEEAAKTAGAEIAVETQGAAGSTPLPDATIADADAVIFAADVEVRGRERFAGKPLVEVPVKQAISHAPDIIASAQEAAQAPPPAQSAGARPAAAAGGLATKVSSDAPPWVRLRQWLMTGVSYMIPFVAAGGILIALGFLFGGYQVASDPATKAYGLTAPSDAFSLFSVNIHHLNVPLTMYVIGKVAFMMLVPIFAGFIAFAIADRPGITPGIVGGLIAVAVGGGFLGGIVAGLIAGAAAFYVAKIPMPGSLRSLMPVIVIPLLATLITGFLMIVVVGKPIAAAQSGLTHWLAGLSGSNGFLLGALLGLMMAFDMGGPVNKVAYTFGIASLASGTTTIMAAVMVAGMTPPLGLALATVVRKHLFTRAERDAGKAAWVLGASFITEGAIPFAASDPIRVIPSLMIGSGVAGALSMAFGCTLRAPHGGIFVTPLVGNPFLYLVALVAGTVVTAVCVISAKTVWHVTTEEEGLLDLAESEDAPVTSVRTPAPA